MLKLALAIFLSLCGVANAQLAGGLQFPGPGTAHSTGGGSPAYTYLGNTSSNGLGPTTMTFPVTMPGAGGALVVYFAVQNSLTISSVVYDPTGANVSLAQVVFDNSGQTNGVWSGTVPSASGSKDIVITASTSMEFLAAAAHAWLGTNLISNSAQTSAANGSSPNVAVAVTATHFLFCGAFAVGANTGVDYSTSTQAPAATHDDGINYSHAADWTIISTDAAFSVTPKSATGFAKACASYH